MSGSAVGFSGKPRYLTSPTTPTIESHGLADVSVPSVGDPPMRAIFIRAPAIASVGPGVEVLARLDDGTIVAARQGNLLATAFHPELTDDSRLHAYWLSLAN